MKPSLAAVGILSLFIFFGCVNPVTSTPAAVKPPASEVASFRIQFGADSSVDASTINPQLSAWSSGLNTWPKTFTSTSGKISQVYSGPPGTFPLTVTTTFINFVSGSYTINGSAATAMSTSSTGTGTGTLTLTGGDISTIVINTAVTNSVVTSTYGWTVNGYPFNLATNTYQ